MVRGTVGQSVVDVLEGHMDTLGEEGERPPGQPRGLSPGPGMGAQGGCAPGSMWGRAAHPARVSVLVQACDSVQGPLPRGPPALPPLPPGVCLSPDGRGAREAHIKLPQELLAAFPPHTGDDARFLAEVADPNSLDRQ